MNYARVKDILRAHASDWAEIGVSEEAIDAMMHFNEITVVHDDVDRRDKAQYILEFKRDKAPLVAKRRGITPQAARKRFNRYIAQPKKIHGVV